jgi:hypothetical protein
MRVIFEVPDTFAPEFITHAQSHGWKEGDALSANQVNAAAFLRRMKQENTNFRKRAATRAAQSKLNDDQSVVNTAIDEDANAIYAIDAKVSIDDGAQESIPAEGASFDAAP